MPLVKMLNCLQAVEGGLQGIYKLKTKATPGGLDMTVGVHCAVLGPQLPIMLSDVCRLLCLALNFKSASNATSLFHVDCV